MAVQPEMHPEAHWTHRVIIFAQRFLKSFTTLDRMALVIAYVDYLQRSNMPMPMA